ncbi:cytochrome c [Tardiphaga sp. vice352]|uniref:c-type cytochrome n=1 Tax=unclassified Tardiphaga TaxID=2631404 RepID=UPI0011642252|nr:MULTISPECIES: cytochrome c [unclassified Tardiphaga]MBC7586574.1 cytochrome c [Tardiphaga sp.]QDM17801.1 cytochrome c [Tardiphaga sp. vice278]QDM28020.1 cytochrome c [Tardiphaga sp. vice304]QDM33162.1 cytochrome c [Tardiphaga sp. vice352]
MKRSIIVLGAMLLGASAVMAQQDIVKDRQATMKANGRALGGTLSAMAKGDKPYDQAAVDAALVVLDDTAKKLPALFPESTKGMKAEGDYSTSPKLWEDKAGFDAKVASFTKVVTEAKAKIKDLDSLKANVGGIGKECGSCHEAFRLKI